VVDIQKIGLLHVSTEWLATAVEGVNNIQFQQRTKLHSNPMF